MTSKITHVSIVLLLVVIGAGCISNPIEGLTAALSTNSDVIATVNGEDILARDFEAYVASVQGELAEDPSPAPRDELLREFITNRILLQEAKNRGVTVGEDELMAAVADWGPKDDPVDGVFPDQLYEYMVVRKLLRQEALRNVSVTYREMQNYFANHADEFRSGDQARVLEILTATREEALDLREQLRDQDVNAFKAAARARSLGVTAEAGGDLGIFHRGDLPEEFERVVFRLRPGEISEPFQSASGYHLFTLEEWIADHPKRFYEVEEEIFEILTAHKEREAVDKFTAAVLTQARIQVNDPSLQFK